MTAAGLHLWAKAHSFTVGKEKVNDHEERISVLEQPA
jgi:hypothetical protein